MEMNRCVVSRPGNARLKFFRNLIRVFLFFSFSLSRKRGSERRPRRVAINDHRCSAPSLVFEMEFKATGLDFIFPGENRSDVSSRVQPTRRKREE